MVDKVAPLLYEYLNANLYLQDFYQFKKSTKRNFSYETWAQALGVPSKSFLRFAVIGERSISEKLAYHIASYIGFNEAEKEYFFFLVLYTQSSETEAKRIYGKRLTEILNVQIGAKETVADLNLPAEQTEPIPASEED